MANDSVCGADIQRELDENCIPERMIAPERIIDIIDQIYSGREGGSGLIKIPVQIELAKKPGEYTEVIGIPKNHFMEWKAKQGKRLGSSLYWITQWLAKADECRRMGDEKKVTEREGDNLEETLTRIGLSNSKENRIRLLRYHKDKHMQAKYVGSLIDILNSSKLKWKKRRQTVT